VNINQIKRFNVQLEIQINGPSNFHNLGILASEEKSLLTYCNNRDYLDKAISKDNVVAIFVRNEDAIHVSPLKTFILSDSPSIDFFLFHNYLIEHTNFYGERFKTRISDSASIHQTAFIAENNIRIEENVKISPHVVILENTIIREGTYIGPGTVVGIDGTQTIEFGDQKHYRVNHAGGVIIGENTFIGANNSIVKSLFKQYTTVGKNVTIGNQVNIGHNCTIGDDSVILANTVVCGSSIVEKGVRIAPGAVISSAKVVGENSKVTIGAVVTQDVPKGKRVSGNFAIDHEKFLHHIKSLNKTVQE